MSRIVSGLLILLFAGFVHAVHPAYYLQVTGPQAGVISVRFVNLTTGDTVAPSEVLAPTGFINLGLQLDQDSHEIVQAFEGVDRAQLAALTDSETGAVLLPIQLPEATPSTGKSLDLKIILRDHAGKSLGWTQHLPLTDKAVVTDQLGSQLTEKLGQITFVNQLSQEQIDRVIAGLSGSTPTNACEIGFMGRSGRLAVDDSHCKLTASPLLGSDQWDEFCRDNTQGLLKDVVIMSETQCHLDEGVARVVGPEQQQALKRLVIDQWSETAGAKPITNLDWTYLSAVLADWAPMRADDLKRFSYYVSQIAVQRDASKGNQRWFVSQPTFRDTLTSELVRATVTQHFKMRGAFSDWCALNSSNPSANDRCFQLATDVSVRLITIFGFEKLPEFNLSVTAHREAYLSWAKSVVGADIAASSMAYLTDWSIQYGQDNFGQSDCGSLLLFPLGRLMAEHWTPDMQLLSDPNSAAYLKFVDGLASQFERFIQALWQEFEGDDVEGRRQNTSCAKRTLEGSGFQPILPQ